jgi:2-polyprenyl-3-methyl-5-hydroxy-6-metoxy-1,4-benzoquinol methylase
MNKQKYIVDRIKLVLKFAKPYLKDSTVLDLGAGDGSMSRGLLPFCRAITAWDPNPYWHSKLSKLESIIFEEPVGHYDCLLSSNVLGLCLDQKTTLKTWTNLYSPNTLILFSTLRDASEMDTPIDKDNPRMWSAYNSLFNYTWIDLTTIIPSDFRILVDNHFTRDDGQTTQFCLATK